MWQNHEAKRHRVSAILQALSLTMGGSAHGGLYGPEIPTSADGGATGMQAGADLDGSASGAAAALRRRWGWVDPRTWGIPVRSALAAAAVVLLTFLAMAAVVLGVLHRQLLAGVDAAADRRVRDVVAGLQFDPPAELDTGLLATDSQIAVVQVIDSSGAVVLASAGAPPGALADPALFGRAGTPVSTESEDGIDLRVSGAPTDRQGTRYTVLVGADANGVDGGHHSGGAAGDRHAHCGGRRGGGDVCSGAPLAALGGGDPAAGRRHQRP